MARKTILNDLIGQGVDRISPGDVPRQKTRALGAVSKSISDLKTRAIIDIDPGAIEAGGMKDRLEQDSEAHRTLVNSLRDHGQQVPVLVRPHPEQAGRYQIVYGRRRLLALQELNQPVKAMVRDLDDQAVVIAQGQENTARLDLSFIEKVNFARQMREADYKGEAISAALSVDKTVVSRMLKVAGHIPVDLIEAIGPAPNVGRPRWVALADMLDGQKHQVKDLLRAIRSAGDLSSEERFNLAFQTLKASKATQDPVVPEQVKVTRASGQVRLVLPDDAFANWLVDALPSLKDEFAKKS